MYQDEIIVNNLNFNDYGKMILELVEVLVSKKVEEYTNSSNPLTKGVAEVIMSYSEEEIKRLQEQLDRDNVNEINYMIKEASDKAKEEGLAEGARENLEANVKTMYKNGFKPEIIASALSMDINEVLEILNKQ